MLVSRAHSNPSLPTPKPKLLLFTVHLLPHMASLEETRHRPQQCGPRPLTTWPPRRLHVHPETQGGNRASQISPSAVVQARSAGTLPSSSFQIHSLLCVPASFHPDYCQEPPHVSPTGSHLKAGQSFCYINLIISLLFLKSASAYFSN